MKKQTEKYSVPNVYIYIAPITLCVCNGSYRLSCAKSLHSRHTLVKSTIVFEDVYVGPISWVKFDQYISKNNTTIFCQYIDQYLTQIGPIGGTYLTIYIF